MKAPVESRAPAVEAIQQWRYKPAMRSGRPVPVWFNVVMAFRLE